MKKHLTTISSFAMMMFVAFTASFTLTSCGEEVVIDPPIEGKTVFSAGSISFNNEDGTRTTLDKSRTYYWQFNDQIWVNDGGTWLKSSDSELSPDNKSANFYYDKLLTADSYEVVYTGYNSQYPDKVTIPASFTSYSVANTNIGQRGDCGVATATRNEDGTYSFALEHKSSYLGIAPLKTSYLNKGYRWTKIEITDVNGKPIAGTFGFSHANGIDSTSITSPSSTITLNLGNDVNAYLQPYNSDLTYVYTVIPPCHRQLNIKYYFVDDANPTEVMTITKQLNPRKFIENNVVQFRHGLSAEYYQWDAPITEPHDGTRIGSNGNYSKVAEGTQATKSCATMPNANELYWYISAGDPRWDNTTQWTTDGGASYHTGGAWIKKKQYITGFSSTVGKNGVDMRTTATHHSVNTTTYQSGGKPTDTSQYFFLPALGCYWNTQDLVEVGINGWYWSSSSHPTNPVKSYRVQIDSNGISVTPGGDDQTTGNQQRRFAFIAGKGSDWFK